MILDFNKKKAFTLAEVGITVAVIGILVAIVTPATMTRFQNASMALMIKKNYVELQENLTILQTKRYYKSTLGNSIIKSNPGQFLKTYYDYTKDCGSTPQPCFADTYRSLDASDSGKFKNSGYSILTKSGSAIFLNTSGAIVIDINGAEGPNIGGRDMFQFNIEDDFSIDSRRNDDSLETLKSTCLEARYGNSCLEYLRRNDWKMDY